MMGQNASDGINAANKGAAGVSAGAAQLKTSILIRQKQELILLQQEQSRLMKELVS